MSRESNQRPPRGSEGSRDRAGLIVRVSVVLAVAILIGFGLRQAGQVLERREGVAGFGQGVLQGATMPLAFPTLLLGVDVPIYATRNSGVPYKLGYILGITGCGACFFGTIYGRWFPGRKRS